MPVLFCKFFLSLVPHLCAKRVGGRVWGWGDHGHQREGGGEIGRWVGRPWSPERGRRRDREVGGETMATREGEEER